MAAALSGTRRLQTLLQKRALRKLRYDRISADHTILNFCIYEKCSVIAVVLASCILSTNVIINVGAQWLSGRVLDSRQRDRGFEPHRRHCVVVLEQDTFILA